MTFDEYYNEIQKTYAQCYHKYIDLYSDKYSCEYEYMRDNAIYSWDTDDKEKQFYIGALLLAYDNRKKGKNEKDLHFKVYTELVKGVFEYAEDLYGDVPFLCVADYFGHDELFWRKDVLFAICVGNNQIWEIYKNRHNLLDGGVELND